MEIYKKKIHNLHIDNIQYESFLCFTLSLLCKPSTRSDSEVASGNFFKREHRAFSY